MNTNLKLQWGTSKEREFSDFSIWNLFQTFNFLRKKKKKRKGNCSCNIMIMEMNRISFFLVRTTLTKIKVGHNFLSFHSSFCPPTYSFFFCCVLPGSNDSRLQPFMSFFAEGSWNLIRLSSDLCCLKGALA